MVPFLSSHSSFSSIVFCLFSCRTQLFILYYYSFSIHFHDHLAIITNVSVGFLSHFTQSFFFNSTYIAAQSLSLQPVSFYQFTAIACINFLIACIIFACISSLKKIQACSLLAWSLLPLSVSGVTFIVYFCFSVLCRSSPARWSVAQLVHLAHFCTLPCAVLFTIFLTLFTWSFLTY